MCFCSSREHKRNGTRRCVCAKPPHFPGALGFPSTKYEMGKERGEQGRPSGKARRHFLRGTSRALVVSPSSVPPVLSEPFGMGCLRGCLRSWNLAWDSRWSAGQAVIASSDPLVRGGMLVDKNVMSGSDRGHVVCIWGHLFHVPLDNVSCFL